MSITRRASGLYQHRWRDAEGREHGKCFPTWREAKDHEAEIRSAKIRGERLRDSGRPVTLRAFVTGRYLPHLEIGRRPNTVATYRSHLGTHILPSLGVTSSGRSGAPTPTRSPPISPASSRRPPLKP
jgi:hypothetical protein